MILGNSFISRFPHALISNYQGLTLNKSSVTGNLFIQGALEGHQVGAEDSSNTPVVRTNKATISRLDQQFLEYNFLEDLPLSKPCLKCNMQQCSSCESNTFVRTDTQRKQDSEISKLITYLPDKKHICARLPFNELNPSSGGGGAHCARQLLEGSPRQNINTYYIVFWGDF